MTRKNDLIILGRFPKSGRVKTRLGQKIGYAKAAEFYKICLQYLFSEVEKLDGVSAYFYYADGKDQGEVNQWLSDKNITAVAPSSFDVIQHLKEAFAERFNQGAKKVISIGSDIPDLSAELIDKAFQKLDQSDLVIGPDNDGGIYLFGCKKFYPELYSGDYSRGVFPGTLNLATTLGLTYSLLPVLIDIDSSQDLKQWQQQGLNKTHPARQLS